MHYLETRDLKSKTKHDMGHKVGTIYMDSSKAFDGLNHELLIAKLKWYGQHQNTVEFFRSYFTNHYQCCKIIPLWIGETL